MKKTIIFLLSILLISCFDNEELILNPTVTEIQEYYDTDIDSWSKFRKLPPMNFDPMKGKAEIEGIYLTTFHGTYNAAKWKKENEIQYWAVGINHMMFGYDLLDDHIIRVMGNIYSEASKTIFLSNHTTTYGIGQGKSFMIVLRGTDNKMNYSTNILLVYNKGMEEECIDWLNNIRQRGHQLTYYQYEDGVFHTHQSLLYRFKNGWISDDGYNIQIVKGGRNRPWENYRNRKGLGRNPVRDYWLVKAFNGTEAIYRDSISGEFIAFTIKYERNFPDSWGWDNQKNPNMKMLQIAPPVSMYQGKGGDGYTVISDAWKYAALSSQYLLAQNWGLLSVNLTLMLYAVDFNEGRYKDYSKELSWSTASETGWLYENYFWDKYSVQPWGFMMYRNYWQDEYGHLMND